MNEFRKKKGLSNLKIDLELVNLVYDDLFAIFDTGTLNIGGIKNEKGENLGQYLLMHTSNNSYTLGTATESWFNSKKDSFEKDDCFISNKTTSYGFGVICVSDGCIAIAYFYPSNTSSGYCLFN